MKKLGFIGMGIMGAPMSLNLIKKSGQSVMGFDISEERLRQLQEGGGEPVNDISKICETCDIIFLCLPTNDLVKNSIEAVIKTGRKGVVVVDLGSTSPSVIREMSAKAQAAGIHLLDSPVSGGEPKAIDASLVLMCGGEREIYDAVKPLLLCMGSQTTYMGPSGCGSVTKLANNMIVGCNIAAVGEAFAFAAKAGIDCSVLCDAIKEGFAGSAVLSAKGPKIVSRDFNASARIAIHQKDMKNAVQLANEMGVSVPFSEKVLSYMDKMISDGCADEDHCAIVKVCEQDMGVEIR